ncbi:phosphotransferase [Actinoallomurus sp. CA-150999]|uniref:phosphotransferase n=1 Tax=Actinoallomurus sp. CA-150999 TaxID=3239887 RepID=UPI003D8B3FFD
MSALTPGAQGPGAWLERFDDHRAGIDCLMCAVDYTAEDIGWGVLLRAGEVSNAYLWRSGDVRGYCVVIFTARHAAVPTELTDAEAAAFWHDALTLGRAIERHYQPLKVNYLLFGNTVPHSHWHVAPRWEAGTDPAPGGPLPLTFLDPCRQNEQQLQQDAADLRLLLVDPGGKPRHTEPVDVHLILRRDGTAGPEVLLSCRAGQVYVTGLWHLPSGHLDGPHEDVVAALIREAAEETGVAIEAADVRFAVTVHHRSPGGSARIGVFFEVRRWQGTPQILEPAVCDAMDWYRLDDLPSPMVAYCRAGLDAYRAGDRLAVHFQQPADPIAYDTAADRLRHIPEARDVGVDRPEAAVCEFAERAVGRIADWSDVSWAREGSHVWRAQGVAGGVWFVKIHQNDRFHDREVGAYRSWVPTLGAAAPRLVAADPALRAIVITAVPGRSLHGVVHAPDEQRRIFHGIGALAAAIHRSAPARPTPGKPVLLGKLERHLDGARAHLALGDEEFIRATAKRLTHLPDLDLMPTHGDFQLRNLLWDGGTLYVIDFERSEEGPAVRDFVRLSDAWAGRPDLYDATMAGYGRPLTSAEKERLVVDSVLDAVSGIQYGTAHGDLELVERGRRILARLRAADCL